MILLKLYWSEAVSGMPAARCSKQEMFILLSVSWFTATSCSLTKAQVWPLPPPLPLFFMHVGVFPLACSMAPTPTASKELQCVFLQTNILLVHFTAQRYQFKRICPVSSILSPHCCNLLFFCLPLQPLQCRF